MTTAAPSLFTRDDTFFGVCEALGQDFGVSATIFRIAFAVSLLWNPALSVGAYIGLGAVIALSRWVAPNRTPAAAAPAETVAHNDADEMVFAQAA